MIDDSRAEIDQLDRKIIELLGERMQLSVKIGREKQSQGEEIHVKTREIKVLDQVKLLGNQVGLKDSFISNLYQAILGESRRAQGGA